MGSILISLVIWHHGAAAIQVLISANDRGKYNEHSITPHYRAFLDILLFARRRQVNRRAIPLPYRRCRLRGAARA